MGTLHFLHPEWFWLLLAIPVVWVIRLLRHRHKGEWERIVDKHLMPFVLSGKEGSLGLLPLILLSLALLVAVVAMAGPAWEKREVPVFRNQQALVVAMDYSASMYAEDEKPNRLTLARFKLLDLLKSREDGQTGLVVFAGDAFVVSPLTDDTETIQEQVKNLSPEIMPAPGSLLTPAIQRSVELLKQAGMTQGHILLITDGASDPDTAQDAAKKAYSMGYRVSVLAVGTEEGAPVPRARGGFLLDSSGKTVVAKTNLDDLEKIAQAGGGLFARAALGDADLTKLGAQWKAAANNKLTEGEGRQVDSWINEGYWLILVLLPLAALTFRRGWLGAVLICCLLPQPQQAYAFSWNDLWETPDQQGQQAMDNGQPDEAAKLFHDPQWKATAAYKSHDYATAASEYEQGKTTASEYNYGNALARQGKYKEAIAAYEKVLQADPQHADARYNLDVLKKAMSGQDKQQQGQQGEQQQQNQSGQGQQQPQDGQQNQQQQGQQGQQQQPQDGQQNQQQQGQQGQQQQPQDGQQNQQQQGQQGQQENQPNAEQYGKQGEEKEADKQAEQEKKQGQDGEQDKPDNAGQQAGEEDQQQREQEQATEQWLRRIPDDPAGLWRRKFQYQYQQRGTQARGQEW